MAFFHWFSYHYGALSHKEVIKKDIARENPDFIGVFTVYTAKFQRTVLTDIKMMFSLCWMS